MHEPGNPRFLLLLLHGKGMHPEALEPFGSSLGLPALVDVPMGPIALPDGSRAWWPVDATRQDRTPESAPSDLYDQHPEGRPEACEVLRAAIARLRLAWPGLPVILVGYSQGGMLAMEYLLFARDPGIAACALLSSTRIAADEWEPQLGRVRGLPMLVAHGRRDDELPFSAGEALRDLLVQAGARVQWVPFDGGHEIPLVVWRRLRQFLLDDALPANAG